MSQKASVHPHDVGLPPEVVGKRKRFRGIGYVMLLIAVLTAVPGWGIYGVSFLDPYKMHGKPLMQAAVGYSLLIVSSITLVLGLWYLLLAQVRRLARMVEGPVVAEVAPPQPRCGNCGWPCDVPDRFCRHCGKALGGASGAGGFGVKGPGKVGGG